MLLAVWSKGLTSILLSGTTPLLEHRNSEVFLNLPKQRENRVSSGCFSYVLLKFAHSKYLPVVRK